MRGTNFVRQGRPSVATPGGREPLNVDRYSPPLHAVRFRTGAHNSLYVDAASRGAVPFIWPAAKDNRCGSIRERLLKRFSSSRSQDPRDRSKQSSETRVTPSRLHPFMTYPRFKQLWAAAGLNDLKPIDNPTMVDEMSPHTIDALVALADGDSTAFDKVKRILGTGPA